jgi:chorismate synthase
MTIKNADVASCRTTAAVVAAGARSTKCMREIFAPRVRKFQSK